MTFFGTAPYRFQPVPEDGSILVENFLAAARHIPSFFDLLGTAFKPVKSDIDGNITKISRKYTTDPEKFKTFRDLLQDEIDKNNTKDGKHGAVIATVWLRRGLEFMCEFLKLVIDDWRNGKKQENICSFTKQAYENSLKKYHGWFAQKLFSVVSHATPWRKDFILHLSGDNLELEEQCYSDTDQYIRECTENLQAIEQLLKDLELDFTDKV